MPFITDTAMQKVATKLQRFETREEKRKIEVRQKLNEAKTVAESSLGAALVGFMHGRFEDADANFFIPRTSSPADFAMGLTGVGLILVGAPKRSQRFRRFHPLPLFRSFHPGLQAPRAWSLQNMRPRPTREPKRTSFALPWFGSDDAAPPNRTVPRSATPSGHQPPQPTFDLPFGMTT